MSAAQNIYWTRYVLHAERDAYLALGWECRGPVVGHHGIYSVLMIWRGPGEPPEPGAEPGKPKPRQLLPWVRLCALLGGVIGGLIGWGLVR